MEFQKLIESRRSIRKYDGSKKVTKEQIETLIAAATEAPSWYGYMLRIWLLRYRYGRG